MNLQQQAAAVERALGGEWCTVGHHTVDHLLIRNGALAHKEGTVEYTLCEGCLRRFKAFTMDTLRGN